LDSNRNSNALNYALLGIFIPFSFLMLFQSYTRALPVEAYIFVVVLFIVAIGIAIVSKRELVALVGIFSFSLVVRLMYYVSTHFSVLPIGDPYSQYTVLLAFSQTSHVSIFSQASFLNFLTRIPHQYSEWPGFQAFSLSLSRITNLPLFWTALSIPFVLYGIWFIISYAVVRKLFANFTGKATILATLSMGIAATVPTFEMPLVFKYDFLAAIFLLAFILLLLHSFNIQIAEKTLLLGLLVTAIVVTHSLTALMMIIFITFFALAFLFRATLPMLTTAKFSIFTKTANVGHVLALRIFIFVASSIAVWWVFYATYAKTYALNAAPSLLRSISLKVFNPNRVQSASAISVLNTLTPRWLLEILRYRDYFLLGLLIPGILILVVRPSILGKQLSTFATLGSIAIVTLTTELISTLNFGDRAFLTFAPLIASLGILPVAALALRKLNLAKVLGVLILFVFGFTLALGFWGTSYAPVYLYSKSSNSYTFGEHPTNWPQISNYLNYGTPPSSGSNFTCVLTNELFVTSLVVPLQDLKNTFPYTDIRTRPGCIVIIYDSLTHFNSSYIAEPYHAYQSANNGTLPAFSNSAFSNVLANQSDVIFDGGNGTVYYVK
jgi:hypothetical protein